MQNIRTKAKEMMKGSCRVCPVCDGRACAGEVPGMGGLGTGAAFKNNITALAAIGLNMRLIHGAKEPSTRTSWLGLDLELPIVAAPIGGMFNFKEAVPEDEYILAVLEGCREAGSIGCGGDGVPPVITDAVFSGIPKLGGWGIPFIKPWESAEMDEKLERAFATGCSVVGMDLDAAGLVTLRKMGRPVGPKTPAELRKIADKAHAAGLKFIAKGIMTERDAILAVEAGVDCIAVSNHGGRVMEYAPGGAKVLPGIARAVGGAVPIMADGGVRNGADAFKLLALGADVVGIGRPVSLAAIGGGREGVAMLFNNLRGELVQTMILTGCQDVSSINESTLFGCC